MKTSDSIILLIFGLAFWFAGTIYYRFRGAMILETTSSRFWINFVAVPVLCAIVCIAVLRARHIPGAAWASAALLIALPGLFGEAVVLSDFAKFMPRLQASSGAKYGAFLFAAYALFLAAAEVVTLRAAYTPQQ